MSKPKAAAKPPVPSVTGIRLPEDLRIALDAEVAAENTRLAPSGASTSRQALLVVLIREALGARAARAAGGSSEAT